MRGTGLHFGGATGIPRRSCRVVACPKYPRGMAGDVAWPTDALCDLRGPAGLPLPSGPRVTDDSKHRTGVRIFQCADCRTIPEVLPQRARVHSQFVPSRLGSLRLRVGGERRTPNPLLQGLRRDCADAGVHQTHASGVALELIQQPAGSEGEFLITTDGGVVSSTDTANMSTPEAVTSPAQNHSCKPTNR